MSFDEDPRENECHNCNEYEQERLRLNQLIEDIVDELGPVLDPFHDHYNGDLADMLTLLNLNPYTKNE